MLTSVHDRQDLHTRAVTYRGYLRPDGLFDVEAELRDSKGYSFVMAERGPLVPGDVIHHMLIRLTVNSEMVIVAVETSMKATPFGMCGAADASAQDLIGVKVGEGWRGHIERTMGGLRGCAHLRELMGGLGTATIQAVGGHFEHLRRRSGTSRSANAPPHFLNKCMSWDVTGQVVKKHEPLFYRPPDQPVRG